MTFRSLHNQIHIYYPFYMDATKNLLLDYLKSRTVMVLSTSSETGLWATTVFYAIDDEFNIYFISDR